MFTYIVIDDEDLTRKGTIAKIKKVEATIRCVGEAGNGKEALDIIERYNPDIIITDMNMPVMDGTALLPILTKPYPNKPIIVISGYKDFKYTKQAIKAKAVDYLLKPFDREEINSSIQNAIAFIKDSNTVQDRITDTEAEREYACYQHDVQSIKNTILGYHSDSLTITSNKLGFISDNHNYILLTLHSTDNILPESEMQIYLDENGFGDLALYLQHSHNNHLGFLIIFIPKQSVLDPKTLCQKVAKSIVSLYEMNNTTISIGISKSHKKLKDLNDAFLETVAALNSRQIIDKDMFYFFEDKERNIINLNWNKQEELLFRIEAGMTNEVSMLVHELFVYFAKFPNINYSDIKYYCFKLSDSTRTIINNHIEETQPLSILSSMQNILNSMFDISELEAYYLQFFNNITNILKEQGVYATNDIIENVKIYIHNNYYKDLTVELLSSFFYINRSYLSQLFKEKTGENFVDYLNDIRIAKAKQLLTSTDKKMYQIAKSIGYSNIKYFFRIFKRKTGFTPGQWRAGNQL